MVAFFFGFPLFRTGIALTVTGPPCIPPDKDGTSQVTFIVPLWHHQINRMAFQVSSFSFLMAFIRAFTANQMKTMERIMANLAHAEVNDIVRTNPTGKAISQ